MKDKEFTNQYWKQYIMVEKEFKATIRYNALDKVNFSAYSNAYAKLLLQIGSEVDVVAKVLCREINSASKADSIDQYKGIICTHFPEFESVTTSCDDIDLQPWKDWSAASPIWWKVYNGNKHNRNRKETYASITLENYKFAAQGNVLNALAGLYQLEQYLYLFTQHEEGKETPLPGSRLFILTDQGWENKHFGHDSLYFIERGCLYHVEADTPYSDI